MAKENICFEKVFAFILISIFGVVFYTTSDFFVHTCYDYFFENYLGDKYHRTMQNCYDNSCTYKCHMGDLHDTLCNIHNNSIIEMCSNRTSSCEDLIKKNDPDLFDGHVIMSTFNPVSVVIFFLNLIYIIIILFMIVITTPLIMAPILALFYKVLQCIEKKDGDKGEDHKNVEPQDYTLLT